MIGQLLDGNFFQNYGVLIILIVFLVFMLVFSATRRKKDAKMAEDFANNLKVGDKVKTYSGIYGKIISIKNTPSGKICVIETGEGKNTSYMAVDVFAIYNIETPVAEKKDEAKVDGGNQATVADNAEAVVEQSTNVVESEVETPKAEVATEEPKTDAEPQKQQKKSRKKSTEKSELEKIKTEENK